MLHDLVSKASDLLDHLHPDDEMSEDEEVSGAVVCVCVSGCVCECECVCMCEVVVVLACCSVLYAMSCMSVCV